MNLMELAKRTGVTIADLESLVRGDAPVGIAERLGIPVLNLEEFLRQGYANAKMAHRLGTSMATAEELGRAVGPEGRIGIIIGLLLSSKQARAAEGGGS
jgi:hypothetical protein